MKKVFSICLLLLNICFVYAQKNIENYKWWNPAKSAFQVLEGQAWPTEVKSFYDRLPARAASEVRQPVWNLSQNGAGLKIRFKTNAKNITVRYVVKSKRLAMNHFPATGVSGVDLYSLNQDGTWAWANGEYKFADTITYQFSNLSLEDGGNYKDGREYHLYLPLYNSVSWMEIGVAAKDSFVALPVRKEKPIVVYGTSIAQGGCASRPGMAWTAILERDLGIPIVNLGFSGNGRLEKELISLVNEIDAKIFVLDCLPNLNASTPTAAIEVENKIIESVNTLRKSHPKVPIILTEHSGFIENRMDSARRKGLAALNQTSERAFQKLINNGVKDIYRLPASEVSMGTDGTVDGTHPTDLGMYKYAKAYEKIIQSILKR